MRCLGCVITGSFLSTQSHQAGMIAFSLFFCQLMQGDTAFGHINASFLFSPHFFFSGIQLCIATLFSSCCIRKHLCIHIFQTSLPFNTGSLTVNPFTDFLSEEKCSQLFPSTPGKHCCLCPSTARVSPPWAAWQVCGCVSCPDHFQLMPPCCDPHMLLRGSGPCKGSDSGTQKVIQLLGVPGHTFALLGAAPPNKWCSQYREIIRKLLDSSSY